MNIVTLNLRFALGFNNDVKMADLVNDIQEICYNEIGASGFFRVHPITRNEIEAATFVDVEIYHDQFESVEEEIKATLQEWNEYLNSSNVLLSVKLYAIDPLDFLRN